MRHVVRQWCHLSAIESPETAVTAQYTQEIDPQSLGVTTEGLDAIWSAVEALYKTGTQPGISVFIRRRGQVLMNRALGYASGNGPKDPRDEPKQPITTQTPVCLYSASKAVTALLMHKLAEQGAINLLDPVSYYLPEFAANGKQNITIHQILSHRGGIPGLPPNQALETLYKPDEVWRLLCAAKPIGVDGAKLAYHAITGGFVLQRVLEEVTGDTIQNFLDRHIRQPMGMRFFKYGLDEEHAGLAARNYFTGPRPPFPISFLVKRALGASMEDAADISNERAWRAAVIPAANIYGTAEETCNFFQMMLDGGQWNGQQLFEPVTIQRAVQEFGRMQFDRSLCIPMRYSAGFMLGGDPVGLWGPHTGRAFGHIGLINKLCWADPDRQISVAIMTTGLALLAHHVPALINLVVQINRHCPREPAQD